MWYIDGDKLEDMLHFRANVPVKEYFAQMAKASSLPWGIKFSSKTHIAKLFPHCVKLAMRAMANSKEHGTQWWIKNGVQPRINAYYGSLEAYKAIPDWKHFDVSHNSEEYVLLNHGYDESKPMDSLTIADLKQAAEFRGGKLVTDHVEARGLALWDTQLEWQDANGNVYPCAGWQGMVLGNLKDDTLQNIWQNSEKIKWLRSLKMKDLGDGKCCKCDKSAFCAPCLVRNANESPTGNPLEINKHFCAVAAKNKQIVLEWREAQLKK